MVPPQTFSELLQMGRIRIDATNEAIRDLPPERTAIMSVGKLEWTTYQRRIRQRYNGYHPKLKEVKAGAYSLELANPRHEQRIACEIVALAPDEVLLPGLISHATNIIEHPDLVAERITRLRGWLDANE